MVLCKCSHLGPLVMLRSHIMFLGKKKTLMLSFSSVFLALFALQMYQYLVLLYLRGQTSQNHPLKTQQLTANNLTGLLATQAGRNMSFLSFRNVALKLQPISIHVFFTCNVKEINLNE